MRPPRPKWRNRQRGPRDSAARRARTRRSASGGAVTRTPRWLGVMGRAGGRRATVIPNQIVEYLERRKVPYERRTHRRALTAQEVAACMHVTGYRVAKSVIVQAGGKTWI